MKGKQSSIRLNKRRKRRCNIIKIVAYSIIKAWDDSFSAINEPFISTPPMDKDTFFLAHSINQQQTPRK